MLGLVSQGKVRVHWPFFYWEQPQDIVKTDVSRQYCTSGNLNARIRLHQLFSTNRHGWMQWVFDQFAWGPSASVLELGCGTGELWQANATRVGPDHTIIVTDASRGMLLDAKRALDGSPVKCYAAVVAAETIPFPDRTFNAVIANHMLYHVRGIERALSETSRVLQHNGTFYAAANGKEHLRGIPVLVREFDGTIEFPRAEYTQLFGLENGAGQLQRYFSRVEARHYQDSLEVTEALPLVDYVLSMAGTGNVGDKLKGDRIEDFRLFLSDRIQQQGSIHISKNSGMFVATGPIA